MLVGVAAILGSEVVLSPVVSLQFPSCGGRVLASRTETFRDQNHRLQSKFAYCKLFGVYAGVISFMFCQVWVPGLLAASGLPTASSFFSILNLEQNIVQNQRVCV